MTLEFWLFGILKPFRLSGETTARRREETKRQILRRRRASIPRNEAEESFSHGMSANLVSSSNRNQQHAILCICLLFLGAHLCLYTSSTLYNVSAAQTERYGFEVIGRHKYDDDSV